jgi:fructose/tagatose bisphosphate aldolase
MEVRMAGTEVLNRLVDLLGNAVRVDDGLRISILEPNSLQEKIIKVVEVAVLGDEPDRSVARWLIRECALGSKIYPSSIHDLYLARGRGEVRDDFTVPAINLRFIPFYAAKAVFRACMRMEAKAIIFEIARSEIGYTQQRPSEYAACILGAAIAEGYRGPVFLQGDHYQISAKRYSVDADQELGTIRSLAIESIEAGFYNIDIDTSTLVDLSKTDIPDQQEINYTLSAELAAFVRQHEPEGITVSLGGEIGEVGGRNSTEPELRAYMDGFTDVYGKLAPNKPGLSKISIQTGTSHGGVVLPDGSIAQVSVDFDTLRALSAVAKDYEMGGAVQHGASTLPEEAFPKFVEANALEVHLATGFQNIMYDRLPSELLEKIYAYLRENHIDERKPDQTDEQFYYKTRKRAIGPFKQELWSIPVETRAEIEKAWENQFQLLFERLNVSGTKEEVTKHITPLEVHTPLSTYLGEVAEEEDTTDLAD